MEKQRGLGVGPLDLQRELVRIIGELPGDEHVVGLATYEQVLREDAFLYVGGIEENDRKAFLFTNVVDCR